LTAPAGARHNRLSNISPALSATPDEPISEGAWNMAQGDVDPPIVPHVPIRTRGRSPWVQGMACLAMVPLLGFIGQTGNTLWGEWKSLRSARLSERASVVVGYVNINPNPSFAARPADWSHDEGDEAVLWAGWKDGKNRWFRVGRGEIADGLLSMPFGRDVIQAIDVPIYERAGGTCWGRIPDEAPVAGFEGGAANIVYPIKVLDKVELINDQIGDRAVLIVFTPVEETASAFDATFEGRRLTMGHAGYFIGHHPVLYDRGTESLWTERDGSIVAIAGRRKGTTLKRIARLDTVSWSSWRDKHPDSRLVIGADRSLARPVD
jgi:hypothetical protein